jgi:hypothetical protein
MNTPTSLPPEPPALLPVAPPPAPTGGAPRRDWPGADAHGYGADGHS